MEPRTPAEWKTLFESEAFARQTEYYGPLGVEYTPAGTHLRLWAPTAKHEKILILSEFFPCQKQLSATEIAFLIFPLLARNGPAEADFPVLTIERIIRIKSPPPHSRP